MTRGLPLRPCLHICLSVCLLWMCVLLSLQQCGWNRNYTRVGGKPEKEEGVNREAGWGRDDRGRTRGGWQGGKEREGKGNLATATFYRHLNTINLCCFAPLCAHAHAQFNSWWQCVLRDDIICGVKDYLSLPSWSSKLWARILKRPLIQWVNQLFVNVCGFVCVCAGMGINVCVSFL